MQPVEIKVYQCVSKTFKLCELEALFSCRYAFVCQYVTGHLSNGYTRHLAQCMLRPADPQDPEQDKKI